MLEAFLIRFFFNFKDSTYPLSSLAVDKETDLLTFFQSDKELTADIFYTVAFQLLGFSYLVDFEDSDVFRKESGFPIVYGDLIEISISYSILVPKRGTLLSTNLSVTVLFLRIMTIATLTARVWLLFLAMMPFEKSFTLSHVSILTKKVFQT